MIIVLFFLQLSCSQNADQVIDLPKHDSTIGNAPIIDSIYVQAFQDLLDSAKLKGCILISHQHTFYSNDFQGAQKGQLPASTFKILNSIIGLELGLIKDTTTIFPWNGQPQMNPNWESDLKLKDAFQLSCVPCYRELARQIGLTNMIKYTEIFNYGNLTIDTSNLDLFWLMGDSKISPFEQIQFLRQFYEHDFSIKENTYNTLKYILLRESTAAYSLYGKTGWSTDHEHDNTWFVGFVETRDKTVYFATNLEPTENTDMTNMAQNRIELTEQALHYIGL
jgi:beta-lactamase class D